MMSKDSEKSKEEEESSSPVAILEEYFRTPPESEDTGSNSLKNTATLESWKQTSSWWRWQGRLRNMVLIAKSKSQLSRWSSSCSSRRDQRDRCYKNFSLSELESATANFSQENLIGKGGYAEVYKGRLADGRVVAVKRIVKGTVEEKTADFLGELGIMAHVNHPNAAKLIGYATDGGMHLLLHYSELGSLASHLHGSPHKLAWNGRYLAPEYLMHGIVNEKTDVFAYGVLLLELITGRRALDCSHQSLVQWAKPLLRKGNLKELIDSCLAKQYNYRQMYLISFAASLCIKRSSIRRPSMPQVLELLKGNLSTLDWKIIGKQSFCRKHNDDEVADNGLT